MKLITVISESMAACDLLGETIPGFRFHNLDMTGTENSAECLWRMQTSRPIPSSYRFFGNHFDDGDDLVSLRHPTRIFARFWPKRFRPIRLDPETPLDNGLNDHAIEPECHDWKLAIQFAKAFRDDHRRWLIYWGRMGHVNGWRLEGNGIPHDLNRTLKAWFGLLLEQFIPVVDPSIPMIILSDHGTARTGQGGKEFREGFIFSRGLDLPDSCTWTDVREAQVKCLES